MPELVVRTIMPMTSHDDLRREVGVREFHNHLSRYVRQVANGGGEVVVTMRGKRVARLVRMDGSNPLAELRARGLVADPTRDWQPRKRGRATAASPVSDLVADQRR